MTSIVIQAGTLLRRLSSMPIDVPLRNFGSRIGRLSSSRERLSDLPRWDEDGARSSPNYPLFAISRRERQQ